MIREATAMFVRQRLGELLNEVQYRRQRVVITKAGKPVAALIDIDLFERLRNLDREFERLRSDMETAFEDRSEAEISALVDEALEAARARSGTR